MIWRTGRKVGRTIYAQAGPQPSDDDNLIGVMDTPALAAQACKGHNTLTGGQPVTELPETAVDAAARACPFASRDMLRRALKAAAPLIAREAFTDGFTDGVATEKQRIIELATEHEHLHVPAGVRSFAARLTEGDTT